MHRQAAASPVRTVVSGAKPEVGRTIDATDTSDLDPSKEARDQLKRRLVAWLAEVSLAAGSKGTDPDVGVGLATVARSTDLTDRTHRRGARR